MEMHQFAEDVRRGFEQLERGEYPGSKNVQGAILYAHALEDIRGERRRRAREARRAKGLGMIVLSDRLPQTQFPGWNDGPRLAPWLGTGPATLQAAARREQAAFQLAEMTPPDLVLKLHVTPEVAARRKPETPAEQLHTGIDLVRRLRFPPTTRVVELDAEQPLPSVLLAAKRALWEVI